MKIQTGLFNLDIATGLEEGTSGGVMVSMLD